MIVSGFFAANIMYWRDKRNNKGGIFNKRGESFPVSYAGIYRICVVFCGAGGRGRLVGDASRMRGTDWLDVCAGIFCAGTVAMSVFCGRIVWCSITDLIGAVSLPP